MYGEMRNINFCQRESEENLGDEYVEWRIK
jgi:hypothetical protein